MLLDLAIAFLCRLRARRDERRRNSSQGSPANCKIVKLTVNITGEEVEKLEQAAREKGLTRTQTLRSWIEEGFFFHIRRMGGANVILREGDSLREVLWR